MNMQAGNRSTVTFGNTVRIPQVYARVPEARVAARRGPCFETRPGHWACGRLFDEPRGEAVADSNSAL